MWNEGYHHTKTEGKKVMERLAAVEGNLDEADAQKWFAEYCMHNPGFLAKLLMFNAPPGEKQISLSKIQDLIIRSFFIKDFSIMIAGRGFSKSWTTAVFIVLYALCNPGCRIGICSAVFRQSRLILETIEGFIGSNGGGLLRNDCKKSPRGDGYTAREPDAWKLNIGTSVITALPLTEKIRGYRFNVVIIDELVLVPQKIIDNVIKPFLSTVQGGLEYEAIRKREDKLIKKGKMQESERTRPPQKNKLIGLSSASHKQSDLYKNYYEGYVKLISDPKAEEVNHCVWRLSYEAAPKGLYQASLVENERKGVSASIFDREWRGLFSDDTDGFYSVVKMEEATLPPGEEPCCQLQGRYGKKYVMGIDPNYTSSATTDNFSISILELSDDLQKGVLVHCYAMSSADTKSRSRYMKYILDSFNIVFITIDNSGGGNFITDCQSFMGNKIKPLQIIDVDVSSDDKMRQTRNNYNPSDGRIVHSQPFNEPGFISSSNYNLQSDILRKDLMFCSDIYLERDVDIAIKADIGIEELEFEEGEAYGSPEAKQSSLIDRQNYLIKMTKGEMAMIECRGTSTGGVQFVLPSTIAKSRRDDPKRPRRDSYTSLLLANQARRTYKTLMSQAEQQSDIFIPVFIGSRRK